MDGSCQYRSSYSKLCISDSMTGTDDLTLESSGVSESSMQKICREDIRCIAVGDAHSGKNHLLSACEKIDSDKEQAVFLEYSTCKLYNDINHKLVFKGFSGESGIEFSQYHRPQFC